MIIYHTLKNYNNSTTIPASASTSKRVLQEAVDNSSSHYKENNDTSTNQSQQTNDTPDIKDNNNITNNNSPSKGDYNITNNTDSNGKSTESMLPLSSSSLVPVSKMDIQIT